MPVAPLTAGDSPRTIVMKFTRDLSPDQIQGAFRETPAKPDRDQVERLVGYFGAIKAGQEAVLTWAPGGVSFRQARLT